MNIKIEGDPGTGNTYQVITIEHVDSYNPNATSVTVNHIYYGTREVGKGKKADVEAKSPDECREIQPLRDQILMYVSRLSGQVADVWKSNYMKLWEGILALDVVEKAVYNPGKQQSTTFNRNLVANIIHFLGNNAEDCIYVDYNAAVYTEKLEGDKDHSVRAALGKDPSEDITKSLARYIQLFNLPQIR